MKSNGESHVFLFNECPDEIDHHWAFDGINWSEPLPPVKTQDELANDVQIALDAFAREKGFDSINDACSYIDSTNPTWAIEAKRCIELRDLTWAAFYNNEPLPILSWL